MFAVLTPYHRHSVNGGGGGYNGQSNLVPICVIVPRLVVELSQLMAGK